MSESAPKQEVNFNYVDKAALLRPVPNMNKLRERKKGYNDLPIDTTHPKFDEPLVYASDYGLAGQAYYSRPNASTDQPVPSVKPTVYLRQSVAHVLSQINASLSNPAFTDFFDGKVELYIEDALRPVSLQIKLHDELMPALLRNNHPGISDKEIEERLKDIIAVPSSDPKRPSPHATGGAFDIILRYKQNTLDYVEGSQVAIGHSDADTGDRILPDYFELNTPTSEEDEIAKHNRRAYYAIMTGQAFGVDTGLTCNPTEWWHWGSGDQLAAQVRGDRQAYYSLVEPTERCKE